MNFRTIPNEGYVPIKGVRVTFERENDLLTRVFLTTESGDCFCIKLGKQSDCLEVMRRATERQPLSNEAITRPIVESEDPASPAA